MFEDSDSSDSDSEIGGAITTTPAVTATKTEDDEDEIDKRTTATTTTTNNDDDDGKNNPEDVTTTTAAATATTSTHSNKSNVGLFGDSDDEDSDDDEEEFDGKNAVVGTTSNSQPTTSSSSSQPNTTATTPKLEDDMNYPSMNNSSSNGMPRYGGGDDEEEERQQQQQRRKSTTTSEIRRMEILDIAQPRYRNQEEEEKTDVTFHVTKLPNLVGINPEAFDPKTYDAGIEEAEYKGYIHNMIRWRYQTDPATGELLRDGTAQNKLLRESNAKFVKWSDGSHTLHVGNESFEVDNIGELKPNNPTDYTGVNGYLYLSQKATMEKDNHNKEDDDENAPKSLTVLECMGPIQSKMIARPSSLQSEAHKNLTLAVRQRNMKKARIAEYVTQVDPEKEKLDRIKNKEDFNKQQQQKQKRRSGMGGGGGRRRRYHDDEDDEHYDNVNLSRLKRRNYEEDEVDYDYGRDSDEEENEWYKRKKRCSQQIQSCQSSLQR